VTRINVTPGIDNADYRFARVIYAIAPHRGHT